MASSPLRLTTDRDDPCPVPDEILGRLYRGHAHNLSDILATLPVNQRVNLAVFCYGRAHLREIGLAVAATCEHEPLVRIAGRVGEVLFDLSRDRPALTRPTPGRRNITLSKGTSMFAPTVFADDPLDSEMDDGDGALRAEGLLTA
jgi:hypothetical protein